MPVTINTYCRINRNGSININTDPAFPVPEPPYTGSICVSGGGADGTYAFTGFINYYDGIRPTYTSISGFINLRLEGPGGTYSFRDAFGDQAEYYNGGTIPAPAYPYLETLWFFYNTFDPVAITVTKGPC
jgi:hypothetical protein